MSFVRFPWTMNQNDCLPFFLITPINWSLFFFLKSASAVAVVTGEHVLITLVPLLLAIGNWIIMVGWKLNLLAAGLFSLLTKIVGVDFSNLILVMFFLSFLYMLPWVESTAGSSYLQMKLCRKHCRPVSDTGLHWSASSPMVSLFISTTSPSTRSRC